MVSNGKTFHIRDFTHARLARYKACANPNMFSHRTNLIIKIRYCCPQYTRPAALRNSTSTTMPYLVKPGEQQCRNFMARYAAHVCCFPSGRELYFSVPFDVLGLHALYPSEYKLFFDFLSSILTIVAKENGKLGVDNILALQNILLCRRKEMRHLGLRRLTAWENGHGFPVFDHNERLVAFIVDWHSLEQDAHIDPVITHAMMRANYNGFDPFGPLFVKPDDSRADDHSIMLWGKNGMEAFEVRRNGESELFCIFGGIFEDHAQWVDFEKTLTDLEKDMLDSGALQIMNRPDGKWDLVARRHKDSTLRRLGLVGTLPSDSPPLCLTTTTSSNCSSGTMINSGASESSKVDYQERSWSDVRNQTPVAIKFGAAHDSCNDWLQALHDLTDEEVRLLYKGILSPRTVGNAFMLKKRPNDTPQYALDKQDATGTDRSTHDVNLSTPGYRPKGAHSANRVEQGLAESPRIPAQTSKQFYPMRYVPNPGPQIPVKPQVSSRAVAAKQRWIRITEHPPLRRHMALDKGHSRMSPEHKLPTQPGPNPSPPPIVVKPHTSSGVDQSSTKIAKRKTGSFSKPLIQTEKLDATSDPVKARSGISNSTTTKPKRRTKLPGMKTGRYQAYAVSSSEVSPQPSPRSWRNV